MSRTDKDHPRGDRRAYKLRVWVCRRKKQRHDRQAVRLALLAGKEPPATQHRHAALWEAW